MAPVNKMKTYGRSNSSIVNNSIDAFNVLFAKNMTKRLIGRKRKKNMCSIKPLPPRTRSETIFEDSLHVSTEDTFDKLLRGNVRKKDKAQSQPEESNISKLLLNESKSRSVTGSKSFYSPVMTRSRLNAKLSKSSSIQEISSSVENNSNNMTNPYQYRLTEPTVDGIDASLEIESARKNNDSSSYIIVDKIPSLFTEVNSSQPIYNNIFTKTFRDKQHIHCSTPITKSRAIVDNHTMSPIKNISSLVKESFEEIKKWDEKFPITNMMQNESLAKRSSKPPRNSSEECSFKGFTKQEQDVIQIDESSKINPESYTSPMKSVERSDFHSSSMPQNRLIVSLDAFSTFENQNNSQSSKESNLHSETNCQEECETPVNFITKRRKVCSDSQLKLSSRENYENSRSFVAQNKSTIEQSKMFPQICDILSENKSSEDESDMETISLKELVVNLSRIPESTLRSKRESSVRNSLSSFEEFYSKSIREISQCENVINTAKNAQEDKDLIVNLTRNQHHMLTKYVPQCTNKKLLVDLTQNVDIFENFYSENYSVSDSGSCLDTNSNTGFSCSNNHSDESVIESSFIEKPNKVVKNVSSLVSSHVKINSQQNDVLNSSEKNTIIRSNSLSNSRSENSETIKVTYTSVNSYKNNITHTSEPHKLSFISETSLQESYKEHSSDIIESSIQECSPIDADGFKVPAAKILVLKSGKNWRRSLSLYRRSSILIGNTVEKPHQRDIEKCCSQKGDVPEKYPTFNRRLSIRVVPVEQLHPTRIIRATTPLKDYACNTSYVPEQVVLEDNLENNLRCLSLSGRSSVTQNPLPAPVTAREIVLRRCGQTEPIPFSECYPESVLQNCQKIGEGVYGEVFLFKKPKGGTSVMKVIPIEGDQIVNGERQKKFDEILSEVIIAMELSNLRKNNKNATCAFSEVQKIQCVRGRYPEKLLDLWELYEETSGSENDCPDIFREDQLYIVLQLANGGKDLESYIFNNACQAHAMFKQVALALAVAENQLFFEHRDLHWGNVLLSTVEKNKVVNFCLDGETFNIQTKGVEVAIIDFTLSRIEYDGVVIFNDLALDPDLFNAEGDYQFEVYKLMQKKNRNNWLEYEPYTNLLWLHYILDKAITALRYKNAQSKIHKDNLMKLKQLYNEVLNYKSVKDFVFNCLL
nr:uncharacterized protein LOC111516542 isoform X1 [Leptinotarsa decemlineata]XP_023028559.1 uncharacterized protein LOC111516542 isoform X2 [Leptinotarsa decemlineata]